ncbi:MAG: hypothetical protein Q9195_002554 [Heterodermia aff. obscurata]
MGRYLSYLQIGGCDAGEGSQPALVSIASVTATQHDTLRSVSPTGLTSPTATSAPVTPHSQDQSAKMGLSSQSKIGIGVGVALALLIALALVGWECLRYRKRKLEDSAKNGATVAEGTQPYLQRKGELEAEERGKYELHHDECRYELEENETREMAMTGDGINMIARRRVELSGDDPLKELALSPQ